METGTSPYGLGDVKFPEKHSWKWQRCSGRTMYTYTDCADSRATGARSNLRRHVARKNSRLNGWYWRSGTMHLIYWIIDIMENLVPLIAIGMEG